MDAISNEGGNNCRIEDNTVVYGGTDTSALGGDNGGIRLYWSDASHPAQGCTVRGNVLRGFVTGINDDCWGDGTSHNRIEDNTVDAIVHKGAPATAATSTATAPPATRTRWLP